jgi:hypothetical protein
MENWSRVGRYAVVSLTQTSSSSISTTPAFSASSMYSIQSVAKTASKSALVRGRRSLTSIWRGGGFQGREESSSIRGRKGRIDGGSSEKEAILDLEGGKDVATAEDISTLGTDGEGGRKLGAKRIQTRGPTPPSCTTATF